MPRHKTIVAIFWSGADAFLRQGIAFLVTLVLARLLGPEEFGTIALLYLFTGLAAIFVDSGFGTALIRIQDATHADESTVFWFNLAAGCAMGALLWLAGPAIAAFYETPILVPLSAIMGLNVVLMALGTIHSTLLTKQLDFRTQMKAGAIGAVVSGIVAIAMAWYGMGVWALAAQIVVASFVTTAMLWSMHRWRPGFLFSLASARRLFGFGGYMLAAGLLNVAYERMYTLLIGRMHGTRDLGYYDRAFTTQQLPAAFLSNIMARVAYPIFSAVAENPDRLHAGARVAVRGTMLINAPLMLGLAVVAPSLMLALFGPQWLPSAPILSVLCLAGILWPLHVLNINLLMAMGHSKLVFHIQLLKQTLGIAFLAIGALFGVVGVAWGAVAFSVAAFLINAQCAGRHMGYGIAAQTRDVAPICAVAAAMALGLHVADRFLTLPQPIDLLVLIPLAVVLLAVLLAIVRLRAVSDCLALLRTPPGEIQPSGVDR